MDTLRTKINNIDNVILSLIKSRMELSLKIGKFKKENNLPVLDNSREIIVLNRLKNLNKQSEFKLEDTFIEEIWNNIMNYSKKIQ